MDCRTASELLVPWLEDELAPAEAEMLDAHVGHCADCACVAGRLAEQEDALRALRPVPDPRLEDPAFWSSMDTTLDAEWETIQAERAQEAAATASLTGRLRRRVLGAELRVSPVGLAAYAAALLLALVWGWSNLEDAQDARAEMRLLERELRVSSGQAAPTLPGSSPRVEAFRTVSHTPHRGTL